MAPKLPTGNFAQLPLAGKIFLLVAGLALLTSGYYLGVHMTLTEEIDAAVRSHATLEQQLREAHARQKEYLRLREEVAAREALDKQNLRILPVSAEIPAFLDDLNRLAELSGLEMSKVEPNPEVAEEFYIRVPVALQLKGRYHELAKFFYNISRLERAINMEDIDVAGGSGAATTDENAEIQLAVSVRATTFRRKE
jgi:type IV pilus assembly protein PilO